MPVLGPLLGELIRQKMIANIQAIKGVDPSAQKNPSYFIQFCQGIAKGLMESTVSIPFVSQDVGVVATPTPIPGVGVGTGIYTDSLYMSKAMYTNIRDQTISQFGQTVHDAWPPKEGNSGEVLKAITDAISDAVHEHYSKALILSSVHPLLITGKGIIQKGSFSGLVPQAVSAAIIKNTAGFQGSFWPQTTLAIAMAYVDTIHNQTTGSVDIGGGGGGAVPGVGTGAAT